MARSLSERLLPQSRRSGQTLAQPVLGELRLWPPLLLALLTVLVLVLVYTVRPTVSIDLGGHYDSAYLHNFHDREVDVAGAGTVSPWPADQNELALRGYRKGTWIAIIAAAEGQSRETQDLAPLDETALAVNGQRLVVVRRPGQNRFIAIIPPTIAAAERLTLRLVPALEGNPEPPLGLVGQVELAPARTYRWTQDESAVLLPGLGRGAWQAELTVLTAHPDGQPLNAQIFANDTLLATLPESGTARRVSLLIPAHLMGSGDLALTLRSKTFADPRPLGVFVSNVVVAPVGSRAASGAALEIQGGLPLFVPPWGTLLSSLVLVLSLYACLSLVMRGTAERKRKTGFAAARPWLAAAALVVLVLLGGWALTLHRYPTSFMLARLALLGLWSLVLLLILRPLLVWTFRTAGVPLNGERHTTNDMFSRSPAFINALLLIFFVSYWFKAGGMFYPYFVSIDVDWHIGKVRWILNGLLPLVYGTNSPLNELTMPLAEWGPDKPVIPYSPYFHMFATSFALFPWPMAFTANMFSLLVDCSRVFLIALLVRKSGLSERVALFAALLYAVMPLTFLLHSWGNIPTTFGLWWTLMATTFAVVAWRRLHRPVPFIVLTFLFLGSLLFYTVGGVFMGMFVLIFIPIMWLIARYDSTAHDLAAGLRPFGLAALAALALSLLIYYGQYIAPIVERTIPYMLNLATQGPEAVGVERPSFGTYMLSYIPHLDYRMWPGDYLYYGIAIPLLFVVPGFLALRTRSLLWAVLSAWFTVALIFMLAGYRISMVDKQLFYIIPAICICWAVYAERYWHRGRWGKVLIITVYVFTFVSALDLWVLRIARSPLT